jgi:hypothetical protein
MAPQCCDQRSLVEGTDQFIAGSALAVASFEMGAWS